MTNEEAIKEIKRWTPILMFSGKCTEKTSGAQDLAISVLSENRGEWIPIKTRPLDEEEKEYYRERGACYFDSIFDCPLPEDGQEVLITTKYGLIDMVTFYNEGDDGSYFENFEDDGEVLAWQALPKPYVGPQKSGG